MTEIELQFKAGVNKEEFEYLHPKARAGCALLALMLSEAGYTSEVTSILRKAGSIKDESGVHATLRAIDLAPRGKTIDSAVMKIIAQAMNAIYKRTDKFAFCMWHEVGHGWHFHLQAQHSHGWIDANGDLEEFKKLKA